MGCLAARFAVGLLSAGFALVAVTVSAQSDRGGGEVSDIAPLADRTLALDACELADHVIAVGDRGHVLSASGPGSPWQQIQVSTQRMLCAVGGSGSMVWAVGHDAIVLHSADAGQTWVEQFAAPEEEAPLLDLWVESEQRVLAVGAYGLCVESTDSGSNWTRRALLPDDDSHLYDIAESDEGVLYVAGEFGLILRSTDRGRTWEQMNSPYGGSFFGILPLRDESLLVFGLRGHLYRSEDRGDSWQPLPTGTTESLLGGVQRENGEVLIVGLSGCVLRSQDGGRDFVTSFRDDRSALANVREFGGQLLVIGEHGLEWVAGSDVASRSNRDQGGDEPR